MRTVAELTELRERAYAKVKMRDDNQPSGEKIKRQVLLCGGTGCLSSNSEKLKARLDEKLAEFGMTDEVQTIMTGCFGLCAEGPIVVVYPEGTMYSKVSIKDMEEIAEQHVRDGNIVERCLIGSGEVAYDENGNKREENIDFFHSQKRVALRNCGRINPENIDEYIAFDGY